MLATSYITIFGLFYAADQAMLIWALATITLLTRKSARKFLVTLRRTTRQVSQAFKTVVTTDIKKSPSDLAIYKAPTLRAVGSVRKVNSVKAKKKTNRVVHLTFPVCRQFTNTEFTSIPFEELTQAQITSNLLTHHVTISNGKSNFLVDPNGEDEFSISLCPVKLMCESREEASAFAGILKELQGAANGDTTIHRMLQSPRFQQTKG
ncbi:hypothetical protein BDR26DRAFT_849936 [Obelidium mucronatum]|nr:hypothetical protein BDR26DRAFT_849936 [Obelidium mucronatum]